MSKRLSRLIDKKSPKFEDLVELFQPALRKKGYYNLPWRLREEIENSFNDVLSNSKPELLRLIKRLQVTANATFIARTEFKGEIVPGDVFLCKDLDFDSRDMSTKIMVAQAANVVIRQEFERQLATKATSKKEAFVKILIRYLRQGELKINGEATLNTYHAGIFLDENTVVEMSDQDKACHKSFLPDVLEETNGILIYRCFDRQLASRASMWANELYGSEHISYSKVECIASAKRSQMATANSNKRIKDIFLRNADAEMFCSEFVVACFEMADSDEGKPVFSFNHRNPQAVSPATLHRYLEQDIRWNLVGRLKGTN